MIIHSNRMADLSNPLFDDMKIRLNEAFKKAIAGMDLRNMNSSTVALKIDIETDRTSIKDENAPIGSREALQLGISYRITTDMRATASTKGNVTPNARSYELVQDDTKRYFILPSEEASGQLNMFNGYDELAEAGLDQPEDEDEEEAE